jgi:hypothetical protein
MPAAAVEPCFLDAPNPLSVYPSRFVLSGLHIW